MEGHPKLGASWEGFVVEEIVRLVGERNAYFWATYSEAGLDMLVMVKGARYGIEVKYSDAPGLTKSMRIALEDLRLKKLLVVYPGEESCALEDRVTVVPLTQVRSELLGTPARRVRRAAS